jgi:hypothetical protein
MTLQAELSTLEKKFWFGDADFYRNHLDDRCLVAFPTMAGVKSKEEIAGMVTDDAPQWKDLKMRDKGFVEPVKGMAVLSYEADGQRASGERYHAFVTSGYVQRDGEWKLAFHQQTPFDERAAERQKH